MRSVEILDEVEEDLTEPGVGPDGESEPSTEGAEGDDTKDEPLVPDESSILRRENAHLKREADHFKTAHDKLGGKYGPELARLRKENEQLRRGGGREEDVDDDDPSEGRRREVSQPTDPRLDQLIDREQEKAEREDVSSANDAYNAAIGRFDADFPNLDKGITKSIGKFVNENKQQIQDAIDKGDARQVEFVTERLLTRAMNHAVSARRTGNLEAETDRKEKLVAQKREATQPGRTSPGSATRGKGSKNPEDMSIEEIRAEYRKAGRRGF